MGDWLEVDAQRLHTAQAAVRHVANSTVSLSPYDLPLAVRGWRDPRRQLFVVELQYLGDEPRERFALKDEQTHMWLGRNSRRLYSLEITLDLIDGPDQAAAGRLVARCRTAIQWLKESQSRGTNYDLVLEVVTRWADHLVARCECPDPEALTPA